MLIIEYKRFKYFVKYSCAQENIGERSKSYDQRKCTKKKVTLKVLDNFACKYPDPKIYIEENLKEKVRSFILSYALP